MEKPVLVIKGKKEFSQHLGKLEGPLEEILLSSRLYSLLGGCDSYECYSKTLQKIKDYARKIDCDAVVIKAVIYDPGFISVKASVLADLYKKL